MIQYFAYGSNMSRSRFLKRVPKAECAGIARLSEHELRFHKIGKDGSAKCDAFYTGNPDDFILGIVWSIPQEGKDLLDDIEGLGRGYDEKTLNVRMLDNTHLHVTLYSATVIDTTLKPFGWYLEHVCAGARENDFPETYLVRIREVPAIDDPDADRSRKEMEAYSFSRGLF